MVDYLVRLVNLMTSHTKRATTSTPPIIPMIHIGHIIQLIPSIIPPPLAITIMSRPTMTDTITNNVIKIFLDMIASFKQCLASTHRTTMFPRCMFIPQAKPILPVLVGVNSISTGSFSGSSRLML